MWNCNCPCHKNQNPIHYRFSNFITCPDDSNSKDSNSDEDDPIPGGSSDDTIVKSESDKRQFRYIVLANQLKVLLISDPETDKSAAAVSIQAGSMEDPENLPGLAHFCEHMLFLGTEKYPEENSFQKFLTGNGGDYNAFTQRDLTDFYFDVSTSPEALNGALDRFAQFFQTPLFTESSTEREINAVNSEHEKNIPDDSERRAQVDISLTKTSHPYRKFDCGNRLTLFTRPKELSINLQEELHHFYKTHYSANLMSLAVLAKESLDSLERTVTSIFNRIKNQNLAVPSWPESPYGEEEKGTRIDLVPIMDVMNICLVFPVPDYTPHYRSGSMSYVGFLLGHEGKGSLLSYLRKQHWTTNPLLVQYDRPGRGFAFLTIEIDVTPLGMENAEDVIQTVFQYVSMLNKEGPQEVIWNEIRIIGENNFRYMEKEIPMYFVQNVVTLMQNFPIKDVLACKYLISDYRPDLIKEILKLISPKNMRLIISTKANTEIADETEEWYGAQYKYSKIDPELLKKWEKCGINHELKLPEPNKYLPTHFELKARDSKPTGNIPRIIFDNELSRVWFLQDNEFKLPLATIMIAIQSPLPRQDVRNYNLTCLMVRIIEDLIAEYVADAENAGLTYDLEASLSGLSLTVNGYDDKIRVLFHHVLKHLVHFQTVGEHFDDIKEEYSRDLENWKEEEPFVHAIDYTNELLRNFSWSTHALLKSMKDDSSYTSQNLLDYAKKFFSKVKLQWFFHGNFTESEVFHIYQCECKHFETLGSKPPSADEIVGSREAILPTGTTHVFQAEHHTHWNSCTLVIIQCGIGGTRETVLLDLIENALSEPAYDILRTKEQLGYVVLTDVRKSRGTLALRIIVQGEKLPEFLEDRIEAFLTTVDEKFSKLTDEEFDEHLKAVSVLKAEKSKTLYSLSVRIFDEIVRGTYNFDRQSLELEELKTVTRKDVQDFFKAWISPSSRKRKKLAVEIASAVQDTASILHHQQRSAPVSGVPTPNPGKKSKDMTDSRSSGPNSYSTPNSRANPESLKNFNPTKSTHAVSRGSIRRSSFPSENNVGKFKNGEKKLHKNVTMSEIVHAISPLDKINEGSVSDHNPRRSEQDEFGSQTSFEPPPYEEVTDPRHKRLLVDEFFTESKGEQTDEQRFPPLAPNFELEDETPEDNELEQLDNSQGQSQSNLSKKPVKPDQTAPSFTNEGRYEQETDPKTNRLLNEFLQENTEEQTEEQRFPPLASNSKLEDTSDINTWDNLSDSSTSVSPLASENEEVGDDTVSNHSESGSQTSKKKKRKSKSKSKSPAGKGSNNKSRNKNTSKKKKNGSHTSAKNGVHAATMTHRRKLYKKPLQKSGNPQPQPHTSSNPPRNPSSISGPHSTSTTQQNEASTSHSKKVPSKTSHKSNKSATGNRPNSQHHPRSTNKKHAGSQPEPAQSLSAKSSTLHPEMSEASNHESLPGTTSDERTSNARDEKNETESLINQWINQIVNRAVQISKDEDIPIPPISTSTENPNHKVENQEYDSILKSWVKNLVAEEVKKHPVIKDKMTPSKENTATELVFDAVKDSIKESNPAGRIAQPINQPDKTVRVKPKQSNYSQNGTQTANGTRSSHSKSKQPQPHEEKISVADSDTTDDSKLWSLVGRQDLISIASDRTINGDWNEKKSAIQIWAEKKDAQPNRDRLSIVEAAAYKAGEIPEVDDDQEEPISMNTEDEDEDDEKNDDVELEANDGKVPMKPDHTKVEQQQSQVYSEDQDLVEQKEYIDISVIRRDQGQKNYQPSLDSEDSNNEPDQTTQPVKNRSTSSTIKFAPTRTVLIKDIPTWKAGLEYYPVPTPFKSYPDWKPSTILEQTENENENENENGENELRFNCNAFNINSSPDNNNIQHYCHHQHQSHGHYRVGYACWEVQEGQQQASTNFHVCPQFCQRNQHGCAPPP